MTHDERAQASEQAGQVPEPVGDLPLPGLAGEEARAVQGGYSWGITQTGTMSLAPQSPVPQSFQGGCAKTGDL